MTTEENLRTRCEEKLPGIGGGRTAQRWLRMFDWARRESVSTARLAEAHHDAMAILTEAGLETEELSSELSVYAVWASADSGTGVQFDPDSMTITGSKSFCSGLGIVERALVVAQLGSAQEILLDIGTAAAPSLTTDLSQWHSPALAAAATGNVCFDHHPVIRVVGPPGWYLNRTGFWHGAIGPAACWAGGAAGVVDAASRYATPSMHHRVALGGLASELHLLSTLVADAGNRADHCVDDGESARATAFAVRHLAERSTARIIDTFARAFGPRPFVSDAELAQRVMDVQLYTRQQHGDRDLAELAQETHDQ